MTNTNHSHDVNTETISFFKVSGLDCGSCAMRIETALGKIPGVKKVDASMTSETVLVHHEGGVSLANLANKLDSLGFGVSTMSRRSDLVSDQASERELASATLHQKTHHRNEEDDEDNEDHHGHSHHDHASAEETLWWKRPESLIVIGCSLAIGFSYLIGFVSPELSKLAFVSAIVLGISPVAIKAARGVQSGFPFSIESLLVIATLGAIALGAIEEAAFVVVLFLTGELLEGFAARRARSGIRSLTALIPMTAFVERDGTFVEEPISSLTPGTVIIVRPGDRVAVDGSIVSGVSSLDESPVTGESIPKTKNPGDQVFAGSINHDAVLRVRVTADTANNTIARIARLVEQAQERKSPTQRFINRFSRIYTPIVLAVGLAVAVIPPLFGGDWASWIYRGLAVLLIGCPCALVISTPAAIASGIAAGARQGLLLKGGEVLERLATITLVAFDKTGTLTTGNPAVTDVQPYEMDETEVLQFAASVETGSSHPLAKAIIRYAESKGVICKAVKDAAVTVGKGVTGIIDDEVIFLGSPKASADIASISTEQKARIEALHSEGKTTAVLVVQGIVKGIIALRDDVKNDAVEGIGRLRQQGVKILMLTGDNRATAQAIAGQLAIDNRSELLPQDKMTIVTALQAEGQSVAKVGDGINDAPALAAADVGIAMAGGQGGGTDIALETGDAAILQGRVTDVARLIELARNTMRNIHQNLVIAIGLKVVFLITTIVGITGLWPAILADTGATLLVTANALRLLKKRKEPLSSKLNGAPV